ncbi:nitroreductase [Virgisporangium aliadipatigenens]|nr:nitroreductase [Virgisporangium aliadipatigenens]
METATFETLVGEAVRAPSLNNSQPWRFRRLGDTVEVLLDLDRVPPDADPAGRLSRVACGAAAFNLSLGMAVRGRSVTIRPTTEDLVVARLVAAPHRPATPVQRRLYRVLPARHSNRSEFDDTPVPAAIRDELVRAARDEGCRLDLLADPSTVDTVAAIALLPRATDPVLGVLSGPGDRRDDAVRAGVALQRVLLTATAERLAVSVFSGPVVEPGIRERLRTAVGHGHPPQLVLRFGYAPALAPTARRNISSFVYE